MKGDGGSIEQVLRLLHLIPAATRDGGVRYSEVAQELGVPEPTICRHVVRMDRILSLELTEETFALLEDLNLREVLDGSRVFFTAGDVREVPVVYSRRISRWLRERYEGDTLGDGSFREVHSVAEPES